MKGREKAAEGDMQTAASVGACVKRFGAAVKIWTDRYLLRIFALMASLLVFVAGCFMQIRFKPAEQVQTSMSVSGSLGPDMSEIAMALLQDAEFDQGMFNGISSLFVGFDLEENSEKYQEMTNKVQEELNAFLADNMDLVLELSAIYSSSEVNGKEAVRLFNELESRLAGALSSTNLIVLDRLEAEVAYSSAETPTLAQEKLANEMVVRSVLLALTAAVYLYLQIVALVCLIRAAVDLIKKRKPGFGFYVMYLIGFFVLFLLGQLTATGLNGAALASFVLASVFGGLQVLGHMLVNAESGTEAVGKAVSFVSAGFLFAAACLFGAQMYNFGVVSDQLGAVLGLNCFNGYTFQEGEATYMLLVNYLPAALLHIAGLVLVLIALFRTLGSVVSGRSRGMILTAVATVFMLLFYISFNVCASFGLFDLKSVGVEMLVIFVMCFVALFINVLAGFLRGTRSREQEVLAAGAKLMDAERRALEAEFRAREAKLRASVEEDEN